MSIVKMFVSQYQPENTELVSYGVVLVNENSEIINEISGNIVDPAVLVNKDIAGELFGVVNGLIWSYQNNYTNVDIYHNQDPVEKFVTGEILAESLVAKEYLSQVTGAKSVGMQINFVKLPTQNEEDTPFTDRVNQLTKEVFTTE